MTGFFSVVVITTVDVCSLVSVAVAIKRLSVYYRYHKARNVRKGTKDRNGQGAG